jgi:methionyl aminopeptidase
MIVCRSIAEIGKIRQAGKIVAQALDLAGRLIEPGITTGEIDANIDRLIRKSRARAAFKGYRGYPASVCVSIDEQVVHGIPGERLIEEGQLVGIDVGVELDGYYADAAHTFAVGRVSDEARQLMSAGEESLAAGIDKMRPGNHLYDISAAIEDMVIGRGFSVVKEYVGHGIGREMHEEPQIPNYHQSGRGPRLDIGMVFALEPMVNAGDFEVEVLDDKWTVVTKDGRVSVHFEHTVAIMKDGPEVLTVV